MMTPDHVLRWLDATPLQAIDIDCATAVMLKILDGKCKMREAEKHVMEMLYDAVRERPGERLSSELHALIAKARPVCDEGMKTMIYEQRLLAETVISRPVMKRFKAMIRQTGLLDPATDAGDEAA